MKIVIHDANILIDLHIAGLLDVFFDLDLESHTTDLVLAEVRNPLTRFTKNGSLRVKSYGSEELEELVLAQFRQPRRVSIQDCSAMLLAQKLEGILLTGDGNLRHCADLAGITVRGTLWILDELVEAKLLTKREAAWLLKKLIEEGRRLPGEDCNQRLGQWAKG